METYFFVTATLGEKQIKFGPYTKLTDAAEILLDHVDLLLFIECGVEGANFTAEITEEIISGDNKWAVVDTKIIRK